MVGANVVLGHNLGILMSLELTDTKEKDRAKWPLARPLFVLLNGPSRLSLQHCVGRYLYTSVAFYMDSTILATTLI
jgi:hypothetical protein